MATNHCEHPPTEQKSKKGKNQAKKGGGDSKVNDGELNPWPAYIQDRLNLWEKYMAR